jgi:hypothetical protein
MLPRLLTHMLSCKEVTRLLSQGEDRRLGVVERIKLGLHLRVCIACARYSRQLVFLREAMQRYRA